MNKTILAIDTATEACSVALMTNGSSDHIFEICPQQHSQKILDFVDEILSRNKTSIQELDAIAYGCGPGSFTGVRIAASTVQGLAFAHDIETLAISTMAAMAYENFLENQVSESLVMIDARMHEVYTAFYQCHEREGARLNNEEQVLAPSALTNKIAELKDEQMVGTGTLAYANELFINKLPVTPKILYPNARYMLPLAEIAMLAGKGATAKDVSPTYVRDTVTWKKLPGR